MERMSNDLLKTLQTNNLTDSLVCYIALGSIGDFFCSHKLILNNQFLNYQLFGFRCSKSILKRLRAFFKVTG